LDNPNVIDLTKLSKEEEDTVLTPLADSIVYELLMLKLIQSAQDFKNKYQPDAEWKEEDWREATFGILKAATKILLPPLAHPENEEILNRVLYVIGRKGRSLKDRVVLAAVVVPPGVDPDSVPSVTFQYENDEPTKH
jgi:hypothetical protein